MASKTGGIKNKIILIVLILTALIGFVPIIQQPLPKKEKAKKKEKATKKEEQYPEPIPIQIEEERYPEPIPVPIEEERYPEPIPVPIKEEQYPEPIPIEEEQYSFIQSFIDEEENSKATSVPMEEEQYPKSVPVPMEEEENHLFIEEEKHHVESESIPEQTEEESPYREPIHESETIYGSLDSNEPDNDKITKSLNHEDDILNNSELNPIKQQIILKNANKYLNNPNATTVLINDSVYINNILVSNKEKSNKSQMGIWYASPNIFLKITDDISYLYIPKILKSYKPLRIEYNPNFAGGVFTSEFLYLLKNNSIEFNYNYKKQEMVLNYFNKDDENKIILNLKKLSYQSCNNIMKKIKQNYNKVNPNGLMMLLEIMNV